MAAQNVYNGSAAAPKRRKIVGTPTCRKCASEDIPSGHMARKNYICRACEKTRLDEWHSKNPGKAAGYKQKYYGKNVKEYRRRGAEWIAKNPRKVLNWRLMREFGITLEQYEDMERRQNSACAICGGKDKGRRPAVDHSHATGKVRALLCSRCNTTIGQVGERTDLLIQMIRYLEAHCG